MPSETCMPIENFFKQISELLRRCERTGGKFHFAPLSIKTISNRHTKAHRKILFVGQRRLIINKPNDKARAVTPFAG